jgi:rare lipoprotein A
LVGFAPPAAWAETAAVSRPSPTPAAKASPSPSAKPVDQKKWGKLEGNAVWYDVPVKSLAHRRAGKGELTAAHNRLPLGTVVRVTHLANKKNVIVRITDRGITNRRAIIDLCKEAADKLGMLNEGSARVRLEILPDDGRLSAPADSSSTQAHP